MGLLAWNACKSLAFGSWFTSFSRVLPTSRVGYHDGKPIESVVYCLKKTSWKVQAYRIHARAVDVSEMELVSAANEWDFWYKINECVYTVQNTFQVVLCLLYKYWDIHHFGSLFISNLSKMLKFAATYREMTNKTKHQLISKNVC